MSTAEPKSSGPERSTNAFFIRGQNLLLSFFLGQSSFLSSCALLIVRFTINLNFFHLIVHCTMYYVQFVLVPFFWWVAKRNDSCAFLFRDSCAP